MADVSPQVLSTVVLFMAMFAMLAIYASRYKKVPPDKAMVVYGRRMGPCDGQGYRVISGGGKFILPIIESYELLDLSVHTINIDLDDVRIESGEGAHAPSIIEIRATALIKISSEPSALKVAAEHLMHKTNAEIEHMGRSMIDGHLRSTLRTMRFDPIDVDREAVASKIGLMAGPDLLNVGMEVRAITLNSVRLLK